MIRKDVRARIEKVGVVPAVRASNPEDVRFAAERVVHGGIPIVEIAVTVPGAFRAISDLVNHLPDVIVGAGGIMDRQTARQCVDAGAMFLTTDGLILDVVDYAKLADVLVFPGALTPTEVIAAWRAGSDFVKVVPCVAVGGVDYIRALKLQMPEIPLIAAGGVNQQTAAGFVLAGATALGIGEALIPSEAIALRQSRRISELARRFLNFVETARKQAGARSEAPSLVAQTEGSKPADELQPLHTV